MKIDSAPFIGEPSKGRKTSPQSAEAFFMSLALNEARKGLGQVSPNPPVGACVVRGGRIVSVGYHRYFGGPHAEVEAIQKAGRLSNQATLYVTLEPCSTYGKTPPCVRAIQEAGISRVVVGAVDPNPKHAGRGLRMLRSLGIQVKTGVLESECHSLIEAYAKWIKTKIPFVILKLAQSLDGKIATRTGKSKWISSSQARAWLHGLRTSSDAILVGKNTVLKDNPLLTARSGKFRRNLWRIVLDRTGAVPRNAKMFGGGGGPAVLVCSDRRLSQVVKKYSGGQITIFSVRENHGRLDLADMLEKLGRFGLTSILIEGGGEIAWSFIQARLADKIMLVIAPKIIGGRAAKTSVEGEGVAAINQAFQVQTKSICRAGSDFIMEGYFK